MHITAANFSFQALVNDFPVQNNYNPGIASGSMPINEAMLKSGKQRLVIRMTPPVDKQYNIAKEINLSIAELKVSINYGEYGKEKVKDFKTALKYEMPKKDGIFPYYEINLEFEAPIVPYENDIQGWTNGEFQEYFRKKHYRKSSSFWGNQKRLYRNYLQYPQQKRKRLW